MPPSFVANLDSSIKGLLAPLTNDMKSSLPGVRMNIVIYKEAASALRLKVAEYENEMVRLQDAMDTYMKAETRFKALLEPPPAEAPYQAPKRVRPAPTELDMSMILNFDNEDDILLALYWAVKINKSTFTGGMRVGRPMAGTFEFQDNDTGEWHKHVRIPNIDGKLVRMTSRSTFGLGTTPSETHKFVPAKEYVCKDFLAWLKDVPIDQNKSKWRFVKDGTTGKFEVWA
jgi:hypothetical protein